MDEHFRIAHAFGANEERRQYISACCVDNGSSCGVAFKLSNRFFGAASGKDALALVAAGGIDAVLLDLRMPGGLDGIEVLRRIRAGDNAPPVVVLTAFASADNTIEAMRLGAFDHLTKPVGRDDLKSVLLGMLAQRGPTPSPSRVEPSGGLIGASEAIRRVQKTIGLVADGNATVLILGETGTGKELVARALHEHGRRKDKAFIAVNCAAIPTELSGKRIVRPRQRSIHRRGSRPRRRVPRSRRRTAFSRRNRRHAGHDAGKNPARAAGEGCHAGRRQAGEGQRLAHFDPISDHRPPSPTANRLENRSVTS